MTEGLADQLGRATEGLIYLYKAWADGGAALLKGEGARAAGGAALYSLARFITVSCRRTLASTRSARG
jgi:hypothetical protein